MLVSGSADLERELVWLKAKWKRTGVPKVVAHNLTDANTSGTVTLCS